MVNRARLLSKLAFDAFEKYIHPTSYRQIVETESLNQLTSEEQRILSGDQKHSSLSKAVIVAQKVHECLKKLQRSKGSEVDEDVQVMFSGSTSSSTLSVETLEKASLSSSQKGVTEH